MMNSQDPRHSSTEDLLPIVYQELREAARRYFRKQPPGFTLHPTELVNEACVHLLRQTSANWDSPEHFRAIATRKIWQVVIDHLRKRQSVKRGGGREPQTLDAQTVEMPSSNPDKIWHRVPLESIQIEWRDNQYELLDLAEALEDLSKTHARLSEVVILHWFGGLKHADVAEILGTSPSTAEKDFRYALAWLNRRLAGTQTDGA